jgi:hypothetical protein
VGDLKSYGVAPPTTDNSTVLANTSAFLTFHFFFFAAWRADL